MRMVFVGIAALASWILVACNQGINCGNTETEVIAVLSSASVDAGCEAVCRRETTLNPVTSCLFTDAGAVVSCTGTFKCG